MGIPFRVEYAKLDEEELCGDTDGMIRRIRVAEHYDVLRKWRILMHEWVHAVLYVNGAANVLDDDTEEMIAQSLEHAIEEMLLQIGRPLLDQLEKDK